MAAETRESPLEMVPLQGRREYIRLDPDPAAGAKITQLTSQPVVSHDIYPEQRFTSADGRRVAIAREPFGGPGEIWVCDMQSKMRVARVCEGRALAANSHLNAVYYLTGEDETATLMRLDLAALEVEELLRFPEGMAPRKAAVSPDERWLVYGPFNVRDGIYSLRVVEFATGEDNVLCEVADMFNPHHQFDPANTGRLLVQVNRGGGFSASDGAMRLAGETGTTLIIVDVPSGDITPLPAGVPHTPQISGHLCWAGKTGRVLFTRAPGVHDSLLETTGVYSAIPGEDAAGSLALGEPFNHIAATEDGRFFVVDNYRDQSISVGSVETGGVLKLCDSHTHQGSPQYTHVHPYMTPDQQYVIFNSNASGVPQVHAAHIPEGFLDQVLAV